jgi:hypothetical protein
MYPQTVADSKMACSFNRSHIPDVTGSFFAMHARRTKCVPVCLVLWHSCVEVPLVPGGEGTDRVI